MADWPSVCHQHKTRIRITNTQCAPPEKHQILYRHTGGDDDGQFWFNAHALVLRLSLACVMLAFYCALGRRDRRRARSKPALILNIQSRVYIQTYFIRENTHIFARQHTCFINCARIRDGDIENIKTMHAATHALIALK